MNKDKLRLWIDALRSGEYQQGRGQLAIQGDTVMQYCCLGVLCEVAIKDGLDLRVNDDATEVAYDEEDMMLPSRVRNWLGTRETPEVNVVNPKYPDEGDGLVSVIVLNDEYHFDFTQIADALEAEFLTEEDK